jgi:hypothetical protein
VILHVPAHVYACLDAEVDTGWPEPTVTPVGGGLQVHYRGISPSMAAEIVRHCRDRAAERIVAGDETAGRAQAWCDAWLARGERQAA